MSTSGRGNISVGDLDGQVHAHTSGGDIKLGRISSSTSTRAHVGRRRDSGRRARERDAPHLRRRHQGRPGGGRNGARHLRRKHRDRVRRRNARSRRTPAARRRKGGLQGPAQGAIASSGTSGGTVRTTVDAKSGFNLDASTSGGTYREPRGPPSPSQTAASAGTGSWAQGQRWRGPVLKLRTSGGSIVVEPRSGGRSRERGGILGRHGFPRRSGKNRRSIVRKMVCHPCAIRGVSYARPMQQLIQPRGGVWLPDMFFWGAALSLLARAAAPCGDAGLSSTITAPPTPRPKTSRCF